MRHIIRANPTGITCDISGQDLEQYETMSNVDKPMWGVTLLFNQNYGGLFEDSYPHQFDFNEEIAKDIVDFIKNKYSVDLQKFEQ